MAPGREETLVGLLVAPQIQLAAADVVEQDGIVDIRTDARLFHLLHSRHSHAQRSFIVAPDEQQLRQSACRLVIAHLVLLVKDVAFQSLTIADFCHTILSLTIVGHPSPTVGTQLREVACHFKAVCQLSHSFIILNRSDIENQAVGLARPEFTHLTVLARYGRQKGDYYQRYGEDGFFHFLPEIESIVLNVSWSTLLSTWQVFESSDRLFCTEIDHQ